MKQVNCSIEASVIVLRKKGKNSEVTEVCGTDEALKMGISCFGQKWPKETFCMNGDETVGNLE